MKSDPSQRYRNACCNIFSVKILILTLSLSLLHTGCTPSDDLGVMKEILRKYLLSNGTLARGYNQAPTLPESQYLEAFEKVKQSAALELKTLLRNRSNDTAILHYDNTIRNYFNVDGETLVCGDTPAPGNLALDQYVKAWNQMAQQTPAQVITFLNTQGVSQVQEFMRRIRCFGR